MILYIKWILTVSPVSLFYNIYVTVSLMFWLLIFALIKIKVLNLNRRAHGY